MSIDKHMTAKDSKSSGRIQKTEPPKYQISAMSRLKPLPGNRPIASNSSVGMDELLGYLD